MSERSNGAELKAIQHLCSRICHDLVGPAGAVSAGLELLGDEGGAAPDALALAGDSAGQLSRRLAFYRVAFGAGGASGSAPVADARRLAVDLIGGSKVALDWPAESVRDLEGRLAAGEIKLLLVLLLVATELLPRGGIVAVHTARLEEGIGLALVSRGPGARVPDGVAEALGEAVPPENLTAKSVVGDFARRLAASIGADLELADGEADEVRLAAILYRDRAGPSAEAG